MVNLGILKINWFDIMESISSASFVLVKFHIYSGSVASTHKPLQLAKCKQDMFTVMEVSDKIKAQLLVLNL